MQTVQVFECKRCGYDTLCKSNLVRHLQKTVVCPPIVCNESREILLEEATFRPHNKEYYKLLLQCYYKAGSKRTDVGTIDICTSNSNIFVKKWCCWKTGLGEHICFKLHFPKDNMILFLYGFCSDEEKAFANNVLKNYKIKAYELVGKTVKIKDLETGEIIHTF